MSIAAIRKALEMGLDAMTPALATAWENASYMPTPGVPYQRVNLLHAKPDDAEVSTVHTELGLLQVSLCYPVGKGPADAEARADLLFAAFPQGTTLVASGITVIVSGSPNIAPAQFEGDRYVLPIRIPWRAQVPN